VGEKRRELDERCEEGLIIRRGLLALYCYLLRHIMAWHSISTGWTGRSIDRFSLFRSGKAFSLSVWVFCISGSLLFLHTHKLFVIEEEEEEEEESCISFVVEKRSHVV
jgi:hypothetical protein